MTWEGIGLWARAMSTQTASPETKLAIERLVVAYRQFWANASELSRQIGKDLPNLTLHDERHFLALWQRADQIAGPEYQLSPFEAFIFGGAILLHDAANCVAAFPGRLDEIRATDVWQDTAAEWIERNEVVAGEVLTPLGEQEVLFETLRSLHAVRAETLAGLEFGSGSERLHLIQDDQLRIHCGEIIGKIAASHHWNIGKLQIQLRANLGVLAGMPVTWELRPIVLACLLRCADAVQIDQARVPDFLRGLLVLHGVSANHWTAQNRLSAPLVDPQDRDALLFTSTRAFAEDDADAWWVAHDALAMADKELQATDALLRDLKQKPFAIRRIRDAASPERLAGHVEVAGWKPVTAEVRISQVERVVEMFGGEQLYGNQPIVPLRELIQNAVDALQQRRALEQEFEGVVNIRLEELVDRPGHHCLIVEDDGIGMSEETLTGPLIDFGSDYSASGLMKREYPGLRAKRAKRIGRYGVGFFSAFMVADEVLVASRRYNEGVSAFRTLKFRRGLKSRPLLTESAADRPGSRTSTRVSLIISTSKRDKLLSARNAQGIDVPLTLAQVVGALCPAVDADIQVTEGTKVHLAHKRDWWKTCRRGWLEQILPYEVIKDSRRQGMDPENFGRVLDQIAQHLTLIDENDPSAGLACLLGIEGLGVHTVGGLRDSWMSSVYLTTWSGVIDHNSRGPIRQHGLPRTQKYLPAWATLQASSAAAAIPVSDRLAALASAVVDLKGDPRPVACARLNGQWESLETIAQFLISGKIVYCPVSSDQEGNMYDYISCIEFHTQRGGIIFTSPSSEFIFTVDCVEARDYTRSAFFSIDDKMVGFIGVMETICKERQHILRNEEIEEVEFAKYEGTPSELDGLVKGSIAKGPALKLWVDPITADGS